MEKVFVKKHSYGNYTILAVCDGDLLGKVIKDENRGLTLFIDPNFYGGELVDIQKAISMVKEAQCVNMVGNTIVSKAIEEGLIQTSSIVEISGILHAIIMEL